MSAGPILIMAVNNHSSGKSCASSQLVISPRFILRVLCSDCVAHVSATKILCKWRSGIQALEQTMRIR
jgi:hypothetical protein